MGEIPILYRNRELSFDSKTLEQMIYLNVKAGKTGNNLKRFSEIVNQALKEFFEVKFTELKIEHYVDVEEEAHKIRWQKIMEEQAREKDRRRIIKLAKKMMMEEYIEKVIKKEKKSGKKIELPSDIGRILADYGI